MNMNDNLKRQQYHWLWGLRTFSQPRFPSLWSQVHAWKDESVDVEKIKVKQDRIDHLPVIIRIWYWLFNLKQYTEHHYQINAYRAVFVATFDSTSGSAASSLAKNNAKQPGVDQKRASSQALNQPKTDQKKVVLIKEWMKPHLALLGIISLVNVNEELNYSVFKRAYYKKAIASHPDKNPGKNTTELFKAVAQAYEAINAVFNGTSLDNSSLHMGCDDDLDELYRKLSEMDEKLKKMDSDIADLQQDVTEVDVNVKRLERQMAFVQEYLHRSQQQPLSKNTRVPASTAVVCHDISSSTFAPRLYGLKPDYSKCFPAIINLLRKDNPEVVNLLVKNRKPKKEDVLKICDKSSLR